ncbi:MAG TPA: hypothetical protein VMZ91_14260 [Candidatus Paceibacterota bacterium]|nr:hypothetical protein [Candidatus Paceibacterota bacterium]
MPPIPIMPIGRSRNNLSFDIAEEARSQDTERRITEDNNYFEQTGTNPEPYIDENPLIDDNAMENLYDLNSDLNYRSYSEDLPSGIIDPLATTSSTLSISRTTGTSGNTISSMVSRNSRADMRNIIESYDQRQKIKEAEEAEEIKEAGKKFNSAISGLEI